MVKISVIVKKMPHQSCHLLQEGGIFSGHKWDSYLTLRNELSEETHMLTKQKNLLGRGTGVESRRVRVIAIISN